ncbi:DUF2442 domain-containing protein [Endothiovibrio diazotrophicus]
MIEVNYSGSRELSVRFADGLSGAVRIDESFCTGVFESLRNDERIADAKVEHGVVVWPDGLDLAPDTMYRKIKESPDHRCELR